MIMRRQWSKYCTKNSSESCCPVVENTFPINTGCTWFTTQDQPHLRYGKVKQDGTMAQSITHLRDLRHLVLDALRGGVQCSAWHVWMLGDSVMGKRGGRARMATVPEFNSLGQVTTIRTSCLSLGWLYH